MQRTGTLEQVLGKVYDLYIEEKASYYTTRRFLSLMQEEDGTYTFTRKEIKKLLELLK